MTIECIVLMMVFATTSIIIGLVYVSYMYMKDTNKAEQQIKEVERRAEVAERALDLCETAYILSLNHRATEGISGQAIASDFGIHKFFMKQAEKELTEEKNEQV